MKQKKQRVSLAYGEGTTAKRNTLRQERLLLQLIRGKSEHCPNKMGEKNQIIREQRRCLHDQAVVALDQAC